MKLSVKAFTPSCLVVSLAMILGLAGWKAFADEAAPAKPAGLNPAQIGPPNPISQNKPAPGPTPGPAPQTSQAPQTPTPPIPAPPAPAPGKTPANNPGAPPPVKAGAPASPIRLSTGPVTSPATPASATAASQATGSGKFAPILPPKDYSPPVMEIPEKRFDFGSIFKGDEIVHRYLVANKGGSPLIIQNIKPSCGCTYVSHDKVIPPQGNGYITLKLDTSRLRAGEQTKTAEVVSNDPKSPKDRLYMQGKVVTAYKITPENPRIEAVVGSKQASTVVTLEKEVQQPFKVVSVKSQNNRILSDLQETKAGQAYRLNLTAVPDPNSKIPSYSERVNIEVEGEGGKKINQEISVSVQFKERITVNPRTIWFQRNEVKDLREKKTPAVSKTVTVKNETPGEFKFKITQLEVKEGDFKVTQETVKDGDEYRVIISLEKLPEDPNVKSIKGNIVIHTDDPSNKEIQMRVIAYI
ncbi:MAG: DUF1573 domain-containing protein [Planctomycetes bacterium]|nr:DUF1573 domain-containing protein [Planctomycetota bacterium]